MRIFLKNNVYEEALNRIRRLFDEFPEVVVGVSGGKDSTVVFNLCMIVAKEKKRLPLKVMWLDQEIEWEATVEMVKKIMYNPDVEPLWIQVPFVLFNATSHTEHWLECWNPKDEHRWMREKDPVARKENIYNEKRFAKMSPAILKVEIPSKACYIAGVRAEESPSRKMALTHDLTYKDIYEMNKGLLPVVVIDKEINDRMASTIRHNRARGKHSVEGVSDMVFQMLQNGWTDEQICNEIGLEADELIRLKHITGFSKLFEGVEYGKAWVTDQQLRNKKKYEESVSEKR